MYILCIFYFIYKTTTEEATVLGLLLKIFFTMVRSYILVHTFSPQDVYYVKLWYISVHYEDELLALSVIFSSFIWLQCLGWLLLKAL